MHRPRHLWSLLLTPLMVILVFSAAGCAGSEHDQMIRKFFNSSGMGDNSTLVNIGTVSFDPAREGKATNVSFVSETPAQTRVLKLKDFDAAFKTAQAAEADFSKKMKEYQDKNIDAINRVLKIEQAGKGKPAGKDVEVQSAWTKWRDEAKLNAKKVSEARLALAAERKVADLSMPNNDVMQGEVTEATQDVTVTADVVAPDGKRTNKTLVLTLQNVTLKDATGKMIPGKWMITGFKEGAAK